MSRVLATSARWMIEASGRTDAASLLARLGIDDTTSTSHLVDAEEYYAIVELIVADGIDDLAFRSARALEIDTYGALGLVFKTSPDLRAALGRVERYGRLVSHAIRYELRADEHGGAAFVIAGRQPTRRGEEVTNVAALAGTLAFCRQAVDPAAAIRPSAVSFSHRPPASISDHETFFECPVEFGATRGLGSMISSSTSRRASPCRCSRTPTTRSSMWHSWPATPTRRRSNER